MTDSGAKPDGKLKKKIERKGGPEVVDDDYLGWFGIIKGFYNKADNQDDIASTNLKFGVQIDTSTIDADNPSGDAADITFLLKHLHILSDESIKKLIYLMVTRGATLTKEHKGTRPAFRCKATDGSDVQLYVSFATAETSVTAREYTRGRLIFCIASAFPKIIKSIPLKNPLMNVIGWDKLFENREKIALAWANITVSSIAKLSDPTTAPEYSSEDFYVPIPGKSTTWQKTSYKKLTEEEYKTRSDALTMASETYAAANNLDEVFNHAAHTMTGNIFASESVWWSFAANPDKCPLNAVWRIGGIEFGGMLALTHDIRNHIIGSVMAGTAAEKEKKTSNFYSSYMRRCKQLGVTPSDRLFELMFAIMSVNLLPYVTYKTELNGDVKKLVNEFIKKTVESMSKNAPLLI